MKNSVSILLLLISFSVRGQDAQREFNTQDTTARECKLKYPSKARKKGIQGTVEIRVTFDSKCTIKGYKVIKSLGYGCDEAAIECLINAQEKIRKEKNSECEDGFETVFPFNFKLE